MSDEIVELVDEVCGIYFRSILIPKAGTLVRQHAHDHDHATYCGSGRAAMFVNGVMVRHVDAGQAVAVKAGQEHSFAALEDNTRLTCVHSVESAESIKRKGL